MFQPEELSKDEPLFWSTGIGTDVWKLFLAAGAGDLPTVQALLDKDPALIRCAYDYRTPMNFAVRGNQLAIVAFLLERGANPVSSGNNDTLQEMARDRGYTDIQQLLSNAISPEHRSPEAELVAAAIRNRDLAKVRELLDAAPELVHARGETSNQAIHWAVMTRQPAIIDELLARGADINAQRADGARPLQLTNGDYGYRGWRDVPKDTLATPADIFRHLIARGAYLDIYMAALSGNLARVRELLDQDPSLVNRIAECHTGYGGSGYAIGNAATAGHIEIVRLLLERGADPNLPEEGRAPRGHALYSAVSNGHYEVAKLLLEHGATPNAPVESSADPLTIAISNNDQPMIELICSYGAAREVELLAYAGDIQTAAAVFHANPSLANDPVALENAAGQGRDAFVRLMLRYQPDLATRIAVGVASQGTADPIKSLALTEFLFQQGMDPNKRNWLGITPLHRFAMRDNMNDAALFISHGANIDAIDDEYCSTPLGYAARYGKINMVKFLLEQGADPHLPHEPSWAKPLSWATRRGHSAIIDLLQ